MAAKLSLDFEISQPEGLIFDYKEIVDQLQLHDLLVHQYAKRAEH